MKLNEIYNVDCVEGMKKLRDKSVDLVVTSPPYEDMRKYKGYSFNFEDIANERINSCKGVMSSE